MLTKKTSSVILSCIAVFLVIIMTGCAGTYSQTGMTLSPDPEERFDASINDLIDSLVSLQRYSLSGLAPSSVMPGSLKSGTGFSRLEELVMERLIMRLRQQHDIYTLSRQNWFEFREGRPLTFQSQPYGDRNFLKNLVVYEVSVSADEVLKKMTVNIIASDAQGRTIPGIVAGTEIDFSLNSPAQRLYAADAQSNPFPEGMEERPYTSVDRLCFSLAAELADSYRAGIPVDGRTASDREIRVLLYSKPSGGTPPGLAGMLQSSMQQAIVANRGFICAVSVEDFGHAFKQIDFYRQNQQVFEIEESLFIPGTVLLMMENFRHRQGDITGVALRAIWRVSPLESQTGDLIPTNVSGTYISGFTARAYLSNRDIKGVYTASTERKPLSQTVTEDNNSRTGLSRDLGVCFHEFTEVLEKRIWPVLKEAPGVTDIRRADILCAGESRCLCYELYYTGPLEELESYLRQNLRTSKVVPFRIVQKGDNRLDLYFDAGFK